MIGQSKGALLKMMNNWSRMKIHTNMIPVNVTTKKRSKTQIQAIKNFFSPTAMEHENQKEPQNKVISSKVTLKCLNLFCQCRYAGRGRHDAVAVRRLRIDGSPLSDLTRDRRHCRDNRQIDGHRNHRADHF